MTVLEDPSEECEPPLQGVLLGQTSLWLEAGVGEATEFCEEIREMGLVLVGVSLSPDKLSVPYGVADGEIFFSERRGNVALLWAERRTVRGVPSVEMRLRCCCRSWSRTSSES